jgi:hypothetical protein
MAKFHASGCHYSCPAVSRHQGPVRGPPWTGVARGLQAVEQVHAFFH